MITINRTTLSIILGAAGAAFFGYCIYFDNKRRSDPEFKKKLHEKRRRIIKQDEIVARPNLNDQESVQKFFFQELKLGEQHISRGDFDGGVEHFVNAIMVCNHPERLLQMLRNTLSNNVFTLLILKMKGKQWDQIYSPKSSDTSVLTSSDDLE